MLEPATPNLIPYQFNRHPHQSLSTMNWNSKSPKSSTPRLTTDIMPASYCILSIVQGMRALTKKLPGSSLPNSDMLPNSLRISTLPIQPSLVHCQIFDLGAFHFNLKSYWSFFTLLYIKSRNFYLLFYSLIVESSASSLQLPKPPSEPWAILLNSPFCSLRSPWISTRAEETSCLQPQSFLPPSPLHSDSTSDSSTSILLFFRGHDPPASNLSHCFWFETQTPSTMHGIF